MYGKLESDAFSGGIQKRRKYGYLCSTKRGSRKVKESIIDKVRVEQKSESGEEVNHTDIWGKYILCRGSSGSRGGRQEGARAATRWQHGRAQGPQGGSQVRTRGSTGPDSQAPNV